MWSKAAPRACTNAISGTRSSARSNAPRARLRLTTQAYRAFREEASHNAETVRRIAELTYREGRGTILELLDAYSSYLRVEEQALELRGAALFAAVELEQAVGPVSH